MKIDRLFDSAAKQRIADAIRAAEAHTSGQIVPVVVERSRNYHARWVALGTLMPVLIAQALAAVLWPETFPLTPLEFFVSGAVLAALANLPPLARLFVRPDMEAAVHQRAMTAFFDHSLHRTKDETGVLVFASLYERKVVVLGDRAIHERMGDAGWKAAVDVLVKGIGKGDPAGGFCDAIALIGDKLAQEFPRTAAGAEVGLPDEVHVDRS